MWVVHVPLAKCFAKKNVLSLDEFIKREMGFNFKNGWILMGGFF